MKEFYLEEKGLFYKTNTFEKNRLTLVFIHGLSGSSSAWMPYEEILKDKYNILTFDIRGHGKSKKFPHNSDYEIKNFAEDVHSLTKYLNITKFILISHSFGTLIAGEYIKSYKENVLAAVFLSPVFGLEKDFIAKVSRPILKLGKILDFLPFDTKPGHHVDYAKHPNSTDWNLKRCYADVSNTTLRVYLHCLAKSMSLPQDYFLEQINIPTLIVHGTKDTMVKVENSISLSRKIKNSELVIIPDIDHIVVLNKVKEVAEIIESFIKRKNLLF